MKLKNRQKRRDWKPKRPNVPLKPLLISLRKKDLSWKLQSLLQEKPRKILSMSKKKQRSLSKAPNSWLKSQKVQLKTQTGTQRLISR